MFLRSAASLEHSLRVARNLRLKFLDVVTQGALSTPVATRCLPRFLQFYLQDRGSLSPVQSPKAETHARGKGVRVKIARYKHFHFTLKNAAFSGRTSQGATSTHLSLFLRQRKRRGEPTSSLRQIQTPNLRASRRSPLQSRRLAPGKRERTPPLSAQVEHFSSEGDYPKFATRSCIML